MARQGIFTGFTPNDGLGDSLASGAVKVNANFQEIYDTFGDGTNLDANAGAGGTWSKAGINGITTNKYVGIGTDAPRSALDIEGDVNIVGVATGTFKGDGSGLTGVTAIGQGVVLKDDGVLIGVAQSINFTNRIKVGNVFGGNAEVFAEDFVSYANVAGFATYSPVAGYSTITDYATNAGVATYAVSAGIVTFATRAASLPIQVLRESPPTQERRPTHLWQVSPHTHHLRVSRPWQGTPTPQHCDCGV